MPISDAPLSGLVDATDHPSPPVQLDDTDLALLQLLAKDARASQRGLARELGMSAPAIGERITRLERSGVIRGYTVSLDLSAVGYPAVIYLAISVMTGNDQGHVMESLRNIPEVEDVTIVTGAIDMLARIRVRDYAHLRTLLLEHIWQIRGVQRTETMLGIGAMRPKSFISSLLEHHNAHVGQPADASLTG